MDLSTLILLAAMVLSTAAVLLLVPDRVADRVRAALLERLDGVDRGVEKMERSLREDLRAGRGEAAEEAQRQREAAAADAGRQRELTAAEAQRQRDEVRAQLVEMARLQREALEGFGARLQQLTDSNAKRQEELRKTLEQRLEGLQKENAEKLEQMRQTVDEKLQGTLEKRLGESFKLVQGQLEAVQRGLGEMQALATGVGDLKKVLTNVKTRGTWGEVQLGALLEQMLSPDQYAANVAPKPGSGERVEYVDPAPRARAGRRARCCSPSTPSSRTEDYQRLVEASERGDAAGGRGGRQGAGGAHQGVRQGHPRQVRPPAADHRLRPALPADRGALRRGGAPPRLRRGAAARVPGHRWPARPRWPRYLTSLQMGFRTLAIQQRSSEVWQVLGAVKTEFGKFGDVIDKVEKKLEEATNTLATVGQRSRAIERKLRRVQELPTADALRLLPAVVADDADGDSEEQGPA